MGRPGLIWSTHLQCAHNVLDHVLDGRLWRESVEG